MGDSQAFGAALAKLIGALGSRKLLLGMSTFGVASSIIFTAVSRRERKKSLLAVPSKRELCKLANAQSIGGLSLRMDSEGGDISFENADGDVLPPPSPLAKRAKEAARKRSFHDRLRAIIRICLPSFFCKEATNLLFVTVLLFLRTGLSIAVAVTTGHIAAALVAADWIPFVRWLRRFAAIGVPAAVVNAGLKHQTQILSLRFQRRLTERLNQQYITGVNFYKATELPQFKIDNIDQRVTVDVEVFCDQLTELFTSVVKPSLDVVLNTWKMAADLGWRGPAVLFSYFGLAAACKMLLMPNFKELVRRRSELTGNYRNAHSRLLAHAEEIAFYEGALRERGIVRQRFDALYWHTRHISTLKFQIGIVDTWIEKYGASIAGYFVMCLPIFFVTSTKTVSENTRDFVRTRQLMMDLARGLGMLLTVQTQLKMLSGITVRVAEVFESVKQLNEDGADQFDIKTDTTVRDDERCKSNCEQNSLLRRLRSPSMILQEETEFLSSWDRRNRELRRMGRLRSQRSASDDPFSPTSRRIAALKDNAPAAAEAQLVALARRGGPGAVVDGGIVQFERVQIVSPDGRHLVRQPLEFSVPRGVNIMVSGPNGCGKSSLFRVLGGLWPPYRGCVTRPHKADVMFVPQRPYLVMGTLRDQVIYPDTMETMAAKGVSDDDLRSLLALVDPPNTLLQRWDFDTEMNWPLTLSGGQKQRVVMARLFYHQPAYAILDECTSACSEDVTDKIYETCKSLGITLFTIAHQQSVYKHHSKVLRFDGDGGWKLEEMR